VQISGVEGPNARAIAHALTVAARKQTTLELNRGALLAAVSRFPVVRSLSVSARFPHGVRIVVSEQPPVASLLVGGEATAIAADGVVLGPQLASSSLPTVSAGYQPPPGTTVREGGLRDAARVLGAVPRALARYLERAFEGPRGLEVVMRSGLRVYFGDARRAHAKWMALAIVLADSRSAHAWSVDVRVPERPAAAFPPGLAPSTARGGEGAGGATAASSESIEAALASGLAASAGYESSAEAKGASAAKAAETLSPDRSEESSRAEGAREGGSEASATGGGEGAAGSG
jgi:hypothetical protein